ncbi:hypothetical protein CISIN_1g035035mg [Citrus sinensis]|uniref:Uncharacterized protein n=1 Tax=Citrus sinensis TaxID=2711 RepID=A0A067DYY7_CITSI|nr:hypothetical protein CISIN_1g035035mg [Citrus sinensis]
MKLIIINNKSWPTEVELAEKPAPSNIGLHQFSKIIILLTICLSHCLLISPSNQNSKNSLYEKMVNILNSTIQIAQ